jgi:tripartite-type tricarboxylate transporter receptor subunit TctC
MARLISNKLSQELGQPIVIENKPGAGGNIGAADVAKATPDGYTLLMASPPLTISPALYSKLPYKPENLSPIGLIGRVPNVLVVSPDSGVLTLAELTAKSKSQPGRLNYASNGQGTSLHLSAELYKSMADIFITHIPYRGAAAGLTGVISGEVNLMFDNLPSALGLIQSGKLRALAVTTQQRSNALPQVPTMDEAGLKGYQVSAWFGLVAPTGLPANVQTRLEQALQNVAQQADTKSSMVKVGAEPTWLNAQAMSQFMQSDYAQWKDVAQYAKITLD